jgi:hypothetical protein
MDGLVERPLTTADSVGTDPRFGKRSFNGIVRDVRRSWSADTGLGRNSARAAAWTHALAKKARLATFLPSFVPARSDGSNTALLAARNSDALVQRQCHEEAIHEVKPHSESHHALDVGPVRVLHRGSGNRDAELASPAVVILIAGRPLVHELRPQAPYGR